MTLWDLGATLLRRWYVVLGGVMCTALVGLLVMTHGGVYFTRSEVVFLAPSSEAYPNSLITRSRDLIITAGIVAKRINGTEVLSKTGSSSVTIVGRGMRDGYAVTLPDNGGQWASHFNRQVLDIQVVGSSAHEVVATQNEIRTRVADELDELQDASGVAQNSRIITEAVPRTSPVYYMAGDSKRATAMTLLLGAAVTLTAAVAADSFASRKQSRLSAD